MINDKSNPEINFELPENVEHSFYEGIVQPIIVDHYKNPVFSFSENVTEHTIIIGSTGAGKSRFLQKEADKLGISYDELLNEVDLVPYEKGNSISINIWDDYYDDDFIPKGEIQETYAYVEEDVDDEICHTCLSILKAYLDDIDELKENGVKVELVFYDSAEKYPNLVGTEHEHCLYKRWQLHFKHLSHEKRYKLVEMLSSANLEHKGNSFQYIRFKPSPFRRTDFIYDTYF